MAKYFKLGEKATLFVDPLARKKIAGNQIVRFEANDMKTDYFKVAKKNGHIEEADDDEVEEFNSTQKKPSKTGATKKAPVVVDEDDDEPEEDESELTEDQKTEFEAFEKLKVDEMKEKIFADYELPEEETAEVKAMSKKADLVSKFKELLTVAE